MHRLSLLPEPLTGLVIRSFEPKVDRSDWSACFVAHADAIESAWTYRAMDAHRSPPLSPPWPKRLLRAETSVAPTMLRRPGPSLPEAPPSGVATHASSAKDEAKLRSSRKHVRAHGAVDPSAPIKISGCTTTPSRSENVPARLVARLAYILFRLMHLMMARNTCCPAGRGRTPSSRSARVSSISRATPVQAPQRIPAGSRRAPLAHGSDGGPSMRSRPRRAVLRHAATSRMFMSCFLQVASTVLPRRARRVPAAPCGCLVSTTRARTLWSST